MLVTLGPKQIVAAAAVVLLLVWGVSEAPGWIEKYRNGQLHLPFTDAGFTCSPGTKIRIAPEQKKADNPQIWGDWVVWNQDIDASNPLGREADVYAAYLPTGEVRTLATGPALQMVAAIHGNVVIWSEAPFDGSPSRFVGYNLSTRETWTLNISVRGNFGPRGIYENRVLVQVTAEDPSLTGLYVYDLRAERLGERVTGDLPYVTRIWKDNVVWVKSPPQGQQGNSQLMLHNLSTGETRVLLDSPLGISQPDIYENVVVYQKLSGTAKNSEWDIYMLDLAAGKETPIATEEGRPTLQQSPRVAGDWIIYTDASYGQYPTIHAYHIPTHKYVTVEGRMASAETDVWQNRVVKTEASPDRRHKYVVVSCLPEAP